jgi:hypothetical protein
MTETTVRPPSVDGRIFRWLKAERPVGLGLSNSEAGIAGRLLKGHGMEWNPWGLGALIAAVEKGAEKPGLYARTIAKGVVPEWAIQKADAILKQIRLEVANEC